jgi:hypothetical protein
VPIASAGRAKRGVKGHCDCGAAARPTAAHAAIVSVSSSSTSCARPASRRLGGRRRGCPEAVGACANGRWSPSAARAALPWWRSLDDGAIASGERRPLWSGPTHRA